jgi:hypothetical protein
MVRYAGRQSAWKKTTRAFSPMLKETGHVHRIFRVLLIQTEQGHASSRPGPMENFIRIPWETIYMTAWEDVPPHQEILLASSLIREP